MQHMTAMLVYPTTRVTTDVEAVVRDTLHVRRQIQSLELQLRAAMHTDEVLSQYLLQQHGLEI